MRNRILPVALLLLLASCGGQQQPSDDTTEKDITTQHQPDTATKTVEVKDSNLVYHKEYGAKHYFSNSKEKDSFSLNVSGSDLLKSNGVLQIKNAQHKLLYEYKFQTIGLLIDPKSLPVSEQTKQIEEILKHYFDEVHFKSPAIKNTEKFEDAFANPDATMKAAWEQIKTDSKAIRFQHREGYEGQASVAYSNTLKKAILVHYMD